jgi:hypothetical protein
MKFDKYSLEIACMLIYITVFLHFFYTTLHAIRKKHIGNYREHPIGKTK